MKLEPFRLSKYTLITRASNQFEAQANEMVSQEITMAL
ncbi:MAG: hypothetical protein ACJASQ_002244 [Crocinitomicaceae bacterium]|jgi:hypothetical protein